LRRRRTPGGHEPARSAWTHLRQNGGLAGDLVNHGALAAILARAGTPPLLAEAPKPYLVCWQRPSATALAWNPPFGWDVRLLAVWDRPVTAGRLPP
jgi:hypothetical protein